MSKNAGIMALRECYIGRNINNIVLEILQASRIIANLLVAGGTVLFRAATTAYKQAIISALLMLTLYPLSRHELEL